MKILRTETRTVNHWETDEPYTYEYLVGSEVDLSTMSDRALAEAALRSVRPDGASYNRDGGFKLARQTKLKGVLIRELAERLLRTYPETL